MSASVTRPSLTGAYVRRRVRRDGTVRVAGVVWRPRGVAARPGTWLDFDFDPHLMRLRYVGDEHVPVARTWEPTP